MTSYRFSQETFVLFTSTFLTFKGITNIELFQEAFQWIFTAFTKTKIVRVSQIE